MGPPGVYRRVRILAVQPRRQVPVMARESTDAAGAPRTRRGARSGVQTQRPPSTSSATPVMNSASSEAR